MRIQRGKAERLHAAHAAADDGMHAIDSEVIEQQRVRARLVAGRELRGGGAYVCQGSGQAMGRK